VLHFQKSQPRIPACRNIKKSHGIKIALSMHARLSVPYLLVFEFARAFNQLKPIAGRTGAFLIA
jgi:hypothetical protein